MLLFVCAREANLADIRKYGFRYSGMGHKLHRSLDRARNDCSGKLLAIELDREELAACNVKEETVIAPSVSLPNFRNLNPYRPVEPVTAAGGVIARRAGDGVDVLMIYRRGVWDLPKGKCTPGETAEECAVREVCEELGIRSADVLRPLDKTLHGYANGESYAVKSTHWYLMTTSARKFAVQHEEEIEKAAWFAWKDAVKAVGYPTLRELLKKSEAPARKALKQNAH